MAASDFVIVELGEPHRAGWEVLARGYKDFYATPTSDAEYERAWQRLCARDGVFGLLALGAGPSGAGAPQPEVLGLAHYLFHTSIWAERVCYLQDLFTVPAARGQGVARALIDAVAQRARSAQAARYYWLTQDHNHVARALYDRVARNRGFIRYDYEL